MLRTRALNASSLQTGGYLVILKKIEINACSSLVGVLAFVLAIAMVVMVVGVVVVIACVYLYVSSIVRRAALPCPIQG